MDQLLLILRLDQRKNSLRIFKTGCFYLEQAVLAFLSQVHPDTSPIDLVGDPTYETSLNKLINYACYSAG